MKQAIILNNADTEQRCTLGPPWNPLEAELLQDGMPCSWPGRAVSVKVCLLVCYTPASPGGATDWVTPLSGLGGGPQGHSSGSAHACNYLRFARHPVLGLCGASASGSRQVLGDQREPTSTCSPMVGLMNALNHPLVHTFLPSHGAWIRS